MDSFQDLEKQLFDKVSSSLIDKYGVGEDSPEELQRTKEWFENRRGCFTGSEIRDLMSCSAGAMAKAPWGTPEKITALGKGAFSYIKSKARERETGKVIAKGDLFQFKYGKKVEEPIMELFMEQKPDLIFVKHGFEKYNEYLGSSPDGSLIDKSTGEIFGAEFKGAMDFKTESNRIDHDVDQSHQDFWQLQTEMLCLRSAPALFYITGAPVEDAAKVVYGDMTKDEIKAAIGTVDIKLVRASEIHQKAIRDRARLGDNIIKTYLGGMKFSQAIVKCCSEFE